MLPKLRADERKLRQILLNLLSKAVKFTPEGGAVTVAAAIPRGQGLHISVSDTGIGMAPDDIAIALIPFGQVDSDLSRRFDGTGLGLSSAQGIVTAHGGTIEAISTPGEGTTFTVLLPIVD